jgi:hypothetical protein
VPAWLEETGAPTIARALRATKAVIRAEAFLRQ